MNQFYKKITFCLFVLILSSGILAFSDENTVSDEDYFVIYTTKLNQTQKRLTYLNKKSAMAKVGTETIDGLISGTLFYDVKIKGMGAVVTIRYTNFSDEDGWIFDGEIITTSNMAQNGTLAGTMNVTGNNPGAIFYDNVILKSGKPGNGTYGVQQKDKSRSEVPYTLYFKAEN